MAARQSFSDGQRSYEAGDYTLALTHFSKAYELIPSPHAQYWIAMSHDKQGNATQAHTALTAFFAHIEHAAVGEEKVGAARARWAELAALPATVTVTTEPTNAALAVDGAVQAGASPFSLKLLSGHHRLTVNAEGHIEQAKEIDVLPGQTLEQSIVLTVKPAPLVVPVAKPEPVPEQPAVEERKEVNKVPAYVTLGVAGASAIAGTIFGIQALGAKGDFDKNPTERNADAVERNGLIADMAFGVAVTLGITGIVLLTSDDTETLAQRATHRGALRRGPVQPAPRLVVAPYVNPKSGGAAAQIKF